MDNISAEVEMVRGTITGEDYALITIRTGLKADKMFNGFHLSLPYNEYHMLKYQGFDPDQIIELIVKKINS